VTTIRTMPRAMKGTFSVSFEGGPELTYKTSSVCRLSNGCNSNILGTVRCVKLKLTGLDVRDVELTKTKYFQPNTAASTHTTTTVTIITTTITTICNYYYHL